MKKSTRIKDNTVLAFSKRRFSIIGMITLMFCVSACFEPAEGCLEIESLNYDIEADTPCSNCCTLPELNVEIQHRFNTAQEEVRMFPESSVFDATTHLDDFGNPFRFKDLKYFLSGFEFRKADGTKLSIPDSLTISILESGVTSTVNVENNFALVQTANLGTNLIGNIRGSGTFNELRFNVGLVSPTDQALFSELPTGHPLDEEEMYISDTDGFLFMDLEIYRDTFATPTDSVQVLLERTDILTPISLPISFDLNPGFNTILFLQADYAMLLSGVNIATDEAEAIRQKIVNNLANVFSVTEITTNNQ